MKGEQANCRESSKLDYSLPRSTHSCTLPFDDDYDYDYDYYDDEYYCLSQPPPDDQSLESTCFPPSLRRRRLCTRWRLASSPLDPLVYPSMPIPNENINFELIN